MDSSRQCEQVKSDGQRCRARPMKGSSFCFFHNPEVAQARATARQAGGVERSKPATVLPQDTPDLPLATVQEVATLLGQTINQVRRGQVDPRVSNAVGYLAGIMLKAMEQGEIEKRLLELEAIVKQQPTPWRPSAELRP